jgi:signal transduction histidine kinase
MQAGAAGVYRVAMRVRRASPFGLALVSRFSPRRLDWLVVGVTAALALPAVVHAIASRRLAITLALLPFATLPLLWRRRRPGCVLAVLVAALAVVIVAGKSVPRSAAVPANVAVVFGIYAAARYGDDRARAASGAMAGAVSFAALVMLLGTNTVRLLPRLSAAGYGALAAWALGEAARTQATYLVELKARARRLERQRDQHARLAAEEERIRIAREVHDVVTHHVSVIAVQAGAARSTSDSRPERARDALAVIERTARTTLGELRALLGVLRAGEPRASPPPLRPEASLAQLDELVAGARAAGVSVEVQIEGSQVELDPIVDRGAYRVLQEALTNVVKHAPGANARVLVSYRPQELEISVLDDGRAGLRQPAEGHGLIGMRERVKLAGGELQVGRASGGGFQVEARLPLKRTMATGSGERDTDDSPDALPAVSA